MKTTLLLLDAGMGSSYGGLNQLDGLAFSLSSRISRISSVRKSSHCTMAISQLSFASSLWMHSQKDSAYLRVARSHGVPTTQC